MDTNPPPQSLLRNRVLSAVHAMRQELGIESQYGLAFVRRGLWLSVLQPATPAESAGILPSEFDAEKSAVQWQAHSAIDFAGGTRRLEALKPLESGVPSPRQRQGNLLSRPSILALAGKEVERPFSRLLVGRLEKPFSKGYSKRATLLPIKGVLYIFAGRPSAIQALEQRGAL